MKRTLSNPSADAITRDLAAIRAGLRAGAKMPGIRWSHLDDLTLRGLLTSLDPDTAQAAEAERQSRLRMAGGATLELLGEEADR